MVTQVQSTIPKAAGSAQRHYWESFGLDDRQSRRYGLREVCGLSRRNKADHYCRLIISALLRERKSKQNEDPFD